MKKISLWMILGILLYGVIEVLSYGGLFVLNKYSDIQYRPVDALSTRYSEAIQKYLAGKRSYLSLSSTLGWSILKNGSSTLYQSNSSGFRGSKEYAGTPRSGIRRVLTFGDSFTHCDEVENHHTWQAIMERNAPNIEVLNFGVPGFGLDQAYLRFLKDGRQFQSQIVLIGFMSENIFRNVNRYRPFYNPKTRLPLGKPRFVIKENNLSLIPNPLKREEDYRKLLHSMKFPSQLGRNDFYYERRYKLSNLDWSPTIRLVKVTAQQVYEDFIYERIVQNGRYNKNSEAFKVTIKIFDEFYHASLKENSTPIILIFPNRKDIVRYRKHQQKRYSPLLSYFDAAGYKYIDLMDAFARAEIKDLFSGHYTPLANGLVADFILNSLHKLNN